MTEHDLTTLIRHELDNEPAFTLSSQHSIRAGRRKVSRRRWATGIVGAAAVTCGALVLPAVVGGSTPELDVASAESLQQYDPTTFPNVFDAAIDQTLEGIVPAFADERITAYGGEDQNRPLPSRDRDRAALWSGVYTWAAHHWLAVNLFHARAESEGDAASYCREQLAAGYAIRCTVERSRNGAVLITQLEAARKGDFENANGVPGFYGLRDWKSANPDNLWFTRTVQARRAGTYLASARETVKARSLAVAQNSFNVPVQTLRDLALHSDLVFPAPEPE